MRFLSYFLWLLALGLGACAVLKIQQARSLQPATLQAEPFLQDFGTIRQGDIVEAKFRLTNRFAVPLEITNTWAFCSCTTPHVEQTLLQPGESTWVRTTWNTRGLRGDQGTEVTVNYQLKPHQPTSAPLATQSLQLGLKGWIQPRLQLSADSITIDPQRVEPYRIVVTDTQTPK